MANTIINYVITTILGMIIAGLAAWVKMLRQKIKTKKDDEKEDIKATTEAVKMLLRAQLKQDCRYYIEKGSIPESEFEEITEALRIYENDPFNGNGVVHKLYEAVSELPITTH